MFRQAGMMMAMIFLGGTAAWSGPLVDQSAPLHSKARVTEAQRVVPDADEVGIPAYPGSRFCFHSSSGSFNTVLLLTADAYQQVKAWYARRLKGWTCVPYNAKDDKFNCVRGTDLVQIQKGTSSKVCELDGLQTLIGIQYISSGD